MTSPIQIYVPLRVSVCLTVEPRPRLIFPVPCCHLNFGVHPTATLYELRASFGMELKKDLLIQVAQLSGDGLRTTCLKMPTN